ncbi:hypothetical protein HanRHA438_Chr16g0777341 [Helianthus annuus]|nr:hypothetical protein HanRHA438_Chr16g0777341 [Helianthus annuus]
MLKIGIIIKTITSDVMCVMRPFPPRDAYSGYTIPDKYSGKLVPPAGRHHLVMTRVMTQIGNLHPC